MIDSGSTISYIPEHVYENWKRAVTEDHSKECGHNHEGEFICFCDSIDEF